MCLSVPAKVISINSQHAEVEVDGQRRNVYLTCENAGAGDWVLIHGGMALVVLENDVARETVDLLRRMKEASSDDSVERADLLTNQP